MSGYRSAVVAIDGVAANGAFPALVDDDARPGWRTVVPMFGSAAVDAIAVSAQLDGLPPILHRRPDGTVAVVMAYGDSADAMAESVVIVSPVTIDGEPYWAIGADWSWFTVADDASPLGGAQ